MRTHLVAVAFALLACGGPRLTMADPERPARAGPYALDVVDEGGAALPTFSHRGRTYVLGALGQRYLLRVRNGSGRRVEVVVSVDGRDVVDGRPASWDRRGYLVDPYGEITIDGYRLSTEAVAAFRFSSVPRSYASRMGDARDVGVIGAAIFPERLAERVPPLAAPLPPVPAPQPGDRLERGAPAPSSGRSADGAEAPATKGQAFREDRRAERPGLGTEFAEEHGSRVRTVRFERARARPDAVLTLRYDDRQGLVAAGVDLGAAGYRADEAWTRESAQPFREGPFSEPPRGWHQW